jgi:hypothetical protein
MVSPELPFDKTSHRVSYSWRRKCRAIASVWKVAMARKSQAKDREATAPSTANRMPEVIELPPFTQKWGHYRLTESDRTIMLDAILSDPEAWPVQRGTAGARKARFSSHEMDCGSSGGYRVLYAAFPAYGKVVLVTLFSKSEQSNLSNAGRNLVSALLREIEVELGLIAREEASSAPERKRKR